MIGTVVSSSFQEHHICRDREFLGSTLWLRVCEVQRKKRLNFLSTEKKDDEKKKVIAVCLYQPCHGDFDRSDD